MVLPHMAFLSTPSVRRATQGQWLRCVLDEEFLSTPSVRRATVRLSKQELSLKISIHALREEGDPAPPSCGQRKTISIHALREEGDLQYNYFDIVLDDFYPRPP